MDELERIAAAFPALTWTRARRITEGWDHVVVVLDDALVFRFPQEASYRQALVREVEVLDHLAPLLPVRIPRYDRVAPDGSFAGYPLLPGRTLTPAVLASLDGTARETLVDQLAGFLSALHTAPVPGTPLERVPSSSLAEDQEDVRRAAAAHLPAVLTPEELDDVERILADVDALLAADLPEAVVHNDVYSRHLLWDDAAARLGVIDFSDMCRGDPAVDFAELHEYGADFVAAVHARYAGPRDVGLLDRAWSYQRWIGVYMLTDHFDVGKTTWEVARETFDRVRDGRGEG
ncbi:aminoglycoside phosphotransferase family protein [Kocuria sp. CPCC 205268]|uniref:phosphotransferase family protein n=1 Tax=Kocuria oxytropis TaxID=3058913 RepID=UPI0034D4F05D